VFAQFDAASNSFRNVLSTEPSLSGASIATAATAVVAAAWTHAVRLVEMYGVWHPQSPHAEIR
jgi:hypothetical protein